MFIIPVEKRIDWRRPPIVLIALLALNVFIFAFYQSGDNELLYEAAETYYEYGLLDTEWRAYQKYQQSTNLPVEIKKTDEDAIFIIVSDRGFDQYMAKQGHHYIPDAQREKWQLSREHIESLSSRISTKSLGFHTNDISIVQLISHQFLHGDFMHLLGNMVMLVLVGFAAEAALGSAIFLLFYLLSGIAGALLFAALSTSASNLVGASGSISGVMAMYVVLFGFRKIQFFYWVLIFTGYIRAAAIIMLPFYLLKELYSYLTLDGSNVAFTAHIGGFLAGAGLVAITKVARADVIDQDYLDDKPVVVDKTAADIQKVYDQMGQCEFARAWEMLKPVKQRCPERADIVELEYNLVRALHPKKRKDYLFHRLGKKGNSHSVIRDQIKAVKALSPAGLNELEINKRIKLLTQALELKDFSFAELLFESLRSTQFDLMQLAVIARRMAVFCRNHKHVMKADNYDALAQKLASTSHRNDEQVAI